ncbi:MAG TPA: hypothetical protein VHX66_06910 [Solirubrobacteraceae bacterium]|jgi:hypothetical protein|nr:hypothetical protein [Solirubrobacteraceae bacterium]
MAELTLFTLPKGFVDPHVSLIQRNALASWSALAPAVEVIVMGEDPGVEEAAREAGARYVGDVVKNEYGTPLLDSAFARARELSNAPMLCYVNGDIVLLPDFVAAVARLPRDRDHLGIGRRWDTDVTEPVDFSDAGAALRAQALASGALDLGRGSDYFVFRRVSDFGLPPFAVGRPGWDNWMIGRALELHMPLIDMTPSVLAIHQNHGYAHVSGGGGSWEGPEAARNRQLATGIERYTFNPFNATHRLTAGGLRRTRSLRHLRARAEAFITLSPAAAPLYRLIRAARGGR